MNRHQNPQQATMPLSMANNGDTVQLIAIHGGQRLRKRLAELGLNVGMPVRIVQGNGCGPIILAVKNDCRLALGKGMAHHIMVTSTVTTEQTTAQLA